MTSKNLVARAIYEAHKDQSTVKVNLRLKKNGQFSSVEGVVQSVKVAMDGYAYIIIQPKNKKKHTQSVVLSNVMTVVKDNIVIRR